ncbi:MAG: aminopeptidase N [Gammaproteobacteria bacterium]|nr:aminopeptidase N [Gammaproteobacteria bacterium]
MSQSQPAVTYLKDYQPPQFAIDSLTLHFDLFDHETIVTATSVMRRLGNASTLVLEGNELELLDVCLDGKVLTAGSYQASETQLRIDAVPVKFELQVKTRIHPEKNTALEGLYKSSGMFCTQCEAEGFRRITYFLDRPDVMTRYTTTIAADKKNYPVLLSNGNLVAEGELDGGRHFATWEDPFLKPSYLFALVAGNLLHKQDMFVTSSGREVTLRIFVEPANIDKCEHALISLKKSMRWDEEVFGREYDLDIFMIVAVNDFNMGAMENKGLNIFNSACVLARPDTATDDDYENIEGIIGHEYFHNWSGNRVTCRDWFQLSLKEGFTVFRDQEFSSDMGSRAVKRISEVNVLRTAQFPEDAGPMAHPVRPDSYIDISNFYTVTVYNKGAEVVRMIHNLLGEQRFRQGCDLYFDRHDGQAVTTDDFVKAMEDATGVDLIQFRRWYSQAGTPVIEASDRYDSATRTYRLTLRQHCPATPGQAKKLPFHIPVAVGLLNSQGADMKLEYSGQVATEHMLQLTEAEQEFVFTQVAEKPLPSLLRGFSAPVRLAYDYSDEQLMFLMAHDSDDFNRWEAGQRLSTRIIQQLVCDIQQGKPLELNAGYVDAVRKVLLHKTLDRALMAQALSLPNERYLADLATVVDPAAIHRARSFVRDELARRLAADFLAVYAACDSTEPYRYDAQHMGRRSLRNVCLQYLSRVANKSLLEKMLAQFRNSDNMTNALGALAALMNVEGAVRQQALDEFYAKWKHDPLVIDKWLSLQARADADDVLNHVKQLMQHEAFEIRNPNKVRAVVGGFCMGNPAHFHAADGAGYEFLADQVLVLNKLNPQMAARMASGFSQWRRFEPVRQGLMQAQLQRIRQTDGLAKDVFEIVAKSLGEV